MNNAGPTLSVVITSYTLDRLNDITELLDSLKTQTRNPDEIIMVVEKSVELHDRVKQYVEEKTAQNIQVVFNDGEPGLSAGRNLGIKEAKGDIIAFIDDDALPSPDWAEELVKTYRDDSVIGVTGPAVPLWEDESMAWFPEEFNWIIGGTAWYADSRSNGITPVRNVWGMNMAFRKEAFELAGVFSTKLGLNSDKGTLAEEDELSIRIRQKTGQASQPLNRSIPDPFRRLKIFSVVSHHRPPASSNLRSYLPPIPT